jgi:Fic family protein
VLRGYRELEDRVGRLREYKVLKGDRVKALFDKTLGRVSKADIAAYCPDISQTTIERTLRELLSTGYIEKVGKARSTAYIKK